MTAVESRDRLRGNPVGIVPKITGDPVKAGNRHPGSWRATYLPFAGGADDRIAAVMEIDGGKCQVDGRGRRDEASHTSKKEAAARP